MAGCVEAKDARAMVRLVAEVAALRGDHTTSKRYLMNGLKDLVGAGSWVWALGYLDPSRPPVYAAYLHEGFDEGRFARYLQAIEHSGMKVLTGPFTRELMERGTQHTRTREQIDRMRRSQGGTRPRKLPRWPLPVNSCWRRTFIPNCFRAARERGMCQHHRRVPPSRPTGLQ